MIFPPSFVRHIHYAVFRQFLPEQLGLLDILEMNKAPIVNIGALW